MRSTTTVPRRRPPRRRRVPCAPRNPSPLEAAMSAASEAAPPRDRLTGGAALPRRWLWLLRLFRWYARRYVRKHFHAVRLANSGRPFALAGDEPTLIVLNHPAWWDPMICLVL